MQACVCVYEQAVCNSARCCQRRSNAPREQEVTPAVGPRRPAAAPRWHAAPSAATGAHLLPLICAWMRAVQLVLTAASTRMGLSCWKKHFGVHGRTSTIPVQLPSWSEMVKV